MKQYLEIVSDILQSGSVTTERTGTGATKVFGRQMRFNLLDGFPAMTTKKLAWKAVVSELLWFLEGSTNDRRLAEIHYGHDDPNTRTIWTANYEKQGVDLGYENGELGNIYGCQWRSWGHRGFDQIQEVLNTIKRDPFSRRMLVSAWNVEDIAGMALPPCHVLFQFDVEPIGIEDTEKLYRLGDSDDIPSYKLNLLVYCRSQDFFLGTPFNIASYALLTHMMAKECDLIAGDFVWVGGNNHIYSNHVEQMTKQLSRKPLPLPTLWLNPDVESLFDYTVDDIRLLNYKHHDPISGEMAV